MVQITTATFGTKKMRIYSMFVEIQVESSAYNTLNKTSYSWDYEIVKTRAPTISMRGYIYLSDGSEFLSLEDLKTLAICGEEATLQTEKLGTMTVIPRRITLNPIADEENAIQFQVDFIIVSW